MPVEQTHLTIPTEATPMGVSRRSILGGIALAAATASVGLVAEPAAARATPRSGNGFSVIQTSNSDLLERTTIGGVRLPVRRGDAGTILTYVARRFDQEVESLVASQCGGWSPRKISGSSVWSNHASATAVDLNWSKHPQGHRGTFSAHQVEVIRSILAHCEGTVRWGGDYRRAATDEMHFEINVSPSSSALARVARKFGGDGSQPPTTTIWPVLKRGSKGFRVTVLQHLLVSRGYSLKTDGVFGAKTKSAVGALQKKSKLTADGIVGPKTWVKVITTLKRGSRGDAVKAAQVALNGHEAHLKADGIFGADTTAAVRSFQTKSKLTVDGIIGVKTWSQLL